MLKLNILKIPIYISYYFCALITVLLLLDRTGIFFISLTAIIIHESAHLLFMKLCKSEVMKIELTLTALRISTCGTDNKNSMIISLSGPFANLIFCLLFLGLGMKDYAFTNLLVGVFNLLPVAGLDGGDVISVILKKNTKNSIFTLLLILSVIVSVVITVFGVFVFFTENHNPTLIFVGIYLFIETFYKV